MVFVLVPHNGRYFGAATDSGRLVRRDYICPKGIRGRPLSLFSSAAKFDHILT